MDDEALTELEMGEHLVEAYDMLMEAHEALKAKVRIYWDLSDDMMHTRDPDVLGRIAQEMKVLRAEIRELVK